MSGYYGKDVIFYGWNFHPKSPKQMFTKIRKVYTTDVNIWILLYTEPLFGFWGIDANNQMVCLSMEI